MSQLQEKNIFAQEYHNNLEKTKLASSKSGCNSAHAAVDISMELDNLAMEATADW